MKISARNVLKGKIVSVEKGATTAQVPSSSRTIAAWKPRKAHFTARPNALRRSRTSSSTGSAAILRSRGAAGQAGSAAHERRQNRAISSPAAQVSPISRPIHRPAGPKPSGNASAQPDGRPISQ